jgi:hypothetical protein
MTRFYRIEQSVLYSPAWFVPIDEFSGRPKATGLTIDLERFDVTQNLWLPEDVRPVVTPSAAIAYPGLGRRDGPGPVPFRARFAAFGYAPLYPADDVPFDNDITAYEFLAFPYDEANPPAATAQPRLVRLLPGAAYPYGPGVRTVYGVVVDGATQAPVANALVSAEGVAAAENVPWRERTLTDDSGGFRLSLRWEGEPAADSSQVFHLQATERPGRNGALDIRLPVDRNRRLVIEIVSV